LVKRDDIITYLNDYLNITDFNDYGPQGLQVEGKDSVAKIVTGVSACVQLFEQAVEIKADMILVHHGVLWDKDKHILKGGFKKRIKTLLENDITLLAYHLPLDKHPQVGNNAIAARELGVENISEFIDVGLKGEIAPCTIGELVKRVSKIFQCDPLVFSDGPKEIRNIAICSGGAQRHVLDAVEAGVDVYITGEVSEHVLHQAREEKIHFIAAGHHATERLGIKALGEHVGEKFGLNVQFIDVPNPV
jgi:dinuclear metal center YbgI/SA1388 family protein